MHIIRFIKNNLITCVLGLLLIISVGSNAWLFLTRNPTTITDDTIREEVIPIAKLGTYEYNFTELMFLDKANNPIGWKNPITSSRYLATIDGDVLIGVDAENMKIKTSRGAEGGAHIDTNHTASPPSRKPESASRHLGQIRRRQGHLRLVQAQH